MTFSEAQDPADAVARAYQTVRRMVFPSGCAWHEAQTHASLTPYLVEESAEFIEAIDRELSASEVSGELGDVLYQVLFHAALAERDGEGYDLASVASALDEKLRARHPHVFGDRGYMTVEELHREWERLKEAAAGEQRGSRGPLDGVPAGMPTLAKAAKIVERLKRAGLLDPGAHRGAEAGNAPLTTDELEYRIGEDLLALVIEANAAGVDVDRALRHATARLSDEAVAAAQSEPSTGQNASGEAQRVEE